MFPWCVAHQQEARPLAGRDSANLGGWITSARENRLTPSISPVMGSGVPGVPKRNPSANSGPKPLSLRILLCRENPNDAHMAKAVSAPPSRLLNDIVRYAACLILGDFSCAPRNRGIGNDVWLVASA